MPHRREVSIAFIVMLLAAAFFYFDKERCTYSTLEFPTGTFAVSLARTAVEQAHGLSGHAPLAYHEGMLFMFDNTATKYFWMKEMLFPLDLVWLDANMTVLGIVENATPESYPQTFSSPAGTAHVLEIAAHEAGKTGIATGTTAKLMTCDAP